jgi:hypothetical protein
MRLVARPLERSALTGRPIGLTMRGRALRGWKTVGGVGRPLPPPHHPSP